jgi:long-chain acyl-CoA synthetase
MATALGIMTAGGVLVSSGAETPSSEFNELLAKTAVEFAVIDSSLLPKTTPDSANFAEITKIHVFSAIFAVFKRIDPSQTIALEKNAGFDKSAFKKLNPAFIRFSSGTTGKSKGVLLSHETIIARTEAANTAFKLDESDTILWTLPMAHHFAATIMLFLRKGCAIDIATANTPNELLAKLADGSATFAYATPYHYARLATAAKSTNSSKTINDSVKLLITTAMPLSEEISANFAKTFGRQLNQAYGIIECGLPCVNTAPSDTDLLSVGTPTANFAVEIQPIKTTAANLANNERASEIGEVLVKGPGLFDAYLSPWALRREIVDKDGYFHTGDLGLIDSNGKLHLTGRSKSVINFLGLKVFPEKVESVLNSHPEICESRVSGIYHKDFGEVPIAEFVPENSATITNPVELTRFCASTLTSHEVPQEFTPVQSLPKTKNGKLIRK